MSKGYKLVFTTQKDEKVCKAKLDPEIEHTCLELDEEQFSPDDPNIPQIPRHKNCRCRWLVKL